MDQIPFNIDFINMYNVVTRDGRQVSELHLFTTSKFNYRLVVVVEGQIDFYKPDGRHSFKRLSGQDLVMVDTGEHKRHVLI